MPYIKPSDRIRLDPAIESLAAHISNLCKDKSDAYAFVGLVNYSVTTLIKRVVASLFVDWNYHLIATVSGLFHTMNTEWYRRVWAKYEDQKKETNGDVF